jgi:hypothetical protein
MDPATIEQIVVSIVQAIVANAPALIADFSASKPYVDALVGLTTGSNATIAQIQTLLQQADVSVSDFLQPLPPDDGTTTT